MRLRNVTLVGAATLALGVALAATPAREIIWSQGEEESATSSLPIASPTLLPDPSIPPDPSITPTGVLTQIAVDTEDGGFFQVCVADAEVAVASGRVAQIIRKGTEVRIDVGELVTGTETVPLGPTIPVHRGDDGVLIFGYESCERLPEPSATQASSR